MVRYSTNWMGPINTEWIKKHGEGWAAGRIDVYGINDQYPDELALPPMKNSDWSRFTNWLDDFETEEKWTLRMLVWEYEKTNPPITWLRREDETKITSAT